MDGIFLFQSKLIKSRRHAHIQVRVLWKPDQTNKPSWNFDQLMHKSKNKIKILSLSEFYFSKLYINSKWGCKKAVNLHRTYVIHKCCFMACKVERQGYVCNLQQNIKNNAQRLSNEGKASSLH